MSYSLAFTAVFLVNAALLFCCIAYKEKRLSTILALDIFALLGEYVIISAGFLLFDVFAVSRTLLVMLGLNGLAFGGLLLKKKTLNCKPEFDPNPACVLVLLIGLPLIMNQFGFFGMGQDQGVYQIKALDLMYGTTEKQKDFPEYDSLTEEEQEAYHLAVSRLTGYDLYDARKPVMTEEGRLSEVSGIYHGIPTYPALLALWGKMFGAENMMQINLLMYMGFVLIIYGICRNLNLDRMQTLLAMTVTAFSPILIWLAKSSFTELFLAYILAAYFWCISRPGSRRSIVLSALPLCVFAVYHVSLYTLFPMFAVSYLAAYIKSGKKAYITANTISSTGFLLGLGVMVFLSPTYTTNNITKPLSGFISTINDTASLWGIAAMGMLFCAAGLLLVNVPKLCRSLKRFLESGLFVHLVRIIMIGLVLVCLLKIVRSDLFAAGQYPEAFHASSLMAAVYLSGFVVLPIALVLSLIHCRKLLSTEPVMILFISFVYCILFRSAFLSSVVSHYYYYSRYLAPFILIAALLAAVLMTKKVLSGGAAVFAAVSMLPLDLAMYDAKDDTRAEWETILDVCDYIGSEDAVIVSDSVFMTMFLPVKEITGASVYPVLDEDILAQAEALSGTHEQVYILSSRDSGMESGQLTLLHAAAVEASEDTAYADREGFLPFPMDFTENAYRMYLRLYTPDPPESLTLELDDYTAMGFDLGETTHAWSTSENPSLRLSLPEGAYMVYLQLPKYVPFQDLGMTAYPIEILINGQHCDTVDLVTCADICPVFLSEEVTAGGEVQIGFRAALWSPADYGSTDLRKLGFALGDVTIQPHNGTFHYAFRENTLSGSGFGPTENEGFAWSVSEDCSIRCFLTEAGYSMTLEFAPFIPLSQLQLESYAVEVYFNDTFVGTAVLDGTEASHHFTCSLPSEEIRSGNNTITLHSALWSPADYGAGDTRELGFGLYSASFETESPERK